MRKYFAIKNHMIVDSVDVAPFSIESMNDWIERCDFDDWFELDDKSILTLFSR